MNPRSAIALAFVLWISLAAPAAPGAIYYQPLKSFGFPKQTDGIYPRAALIEGSDGVLYGTTSEGGTNGAGVVFKVGEDGNHYQILYHFGSGQSDGRSPQAALVEGSDGALYGTTAEGGTNDLGTVFTLQKDGTAYRVLLRFSTNGFGGADPSGPLIEGRDGALYGMTFFGGRKGDGTVFKLSKDGSGYRVLQSFSGNGSDGRLPSGGPIEGSDGALYGVTWFGGGKNDFGTVFKLDESGSGYRTLHSFSGPDGLDPIGELVEGTDGALYGVANDGGVGTNGYGTIFKLDKDGAGFSVLHSFAFHEANLRAGLTVGRDGMLYGVGGGIFMLSNDGGYSVLCPCDGDSRLLRAMNGVFYGTTFSGGDFRLGTVFRLQPPQTPTMLGTRIVGGIVQVSFAGLSNYNYQIIRSPDLIRWTTLATVVMPPQGVYTNEDSAPPDSAAYYRAVWLP